MSHGTRAEYRQGCRCLPCRRANALYAAQRYASRRRGAHGALVDARDARRHLRKLGKRGIGKRQASRLSGLSLWVIAAVRSGRLIAIRPSTASRILAIRPVMALGTCVSAETVERLVRRLKGEDFDPAALAGRLRLSEQWVRRHHRRVKGRTAARVQRLWDTVMAGGK